MSVEPMETDSETIQQHVDKETLQVDAESKKSQGNELYKQKKYREALDMYSEAIRLIPDHAAYYTNRAASFMMLDNYNSALADARQATKLDSLFGKGYQREAKCLMALGDASGAVQTYERALGLDSNNAPLKQEMERSKLARRFEIEAEKDYEKEDFRRVVYLMNQCLQISPSAVKYKLLRAECNALLGQYVESQEIATEILQSDAMNMEALYVRGLCLYYGNSPEKAQNHFKQVLRLAPDHQRAKTIFKRAKQLISTKEEGNAAFKQGSYEAAHTLYTEALSIDALNKHVNAQLYNNRAAVCDKLGKTDDCVADCTKAIELNGDYVKAYVRRAQCYLKSEMCEECVRDWEAIVKLDGSQYHKQQLREAKLELKKSKRKDYYKILGVHKSANEDEIKKAYRKRAMVHHPDRHSHDSPEKQKEEEHKFKEIGEAYAVLSDSKKKMRYDSGQDLDDMGGDGVDPSQIFQMFFGGGGGGFGGGGGGFEFGGNGGEGGCNGGHYGRGRGGGGFPFGF